MKRIWIMTLFPELFACFTKIGVTGRALQEKFEVHFVNPRDYSPHAYKNVDDYAYGGGPGMVMRADILKDALFEGVIKKGNYSKDFRSELNIIFTAPRGEVWNAKVARAYAENELQGQRDQLWIAGRYEGIDERFLECFVESYFCLGDFVLSGGEVSIMAMLESALRFIPGVLGASDGADLDSFESGLLEFPQYTRPKDFEGMPVPEVLTSGHHAKINSFREEEALRLTKKFRPDLLKKD